MSSERFTDQLRHVLRLAENEAQRLSHDYVGTEHLLVALLREGTNPAARALASLGLTLDGARKALETVPHAPAAVLQAAAPVRTPRARQALEAAVGEADRAAPGTPVGPEHLLLALLRDEDGIALALLRGLGAPPQRVRVALGVGSPSEITTSPAAVPAVESVPAPAPRDEGVQVGTPFDALQPREQPAPPAPVANLGVEAPALGRPVMRSVWLTTLAHCWHLFLHLAFGKAIPGADEGPPPPLPPQLPFGLQLTDQARQVVLLADREARQLRHQCVGTEHLLLGIAREGTGRAVRVLGALGIDLYRLRMEVLKVVTTSPETVLPPRLPLTPHALAALQRASAEALSNGRPVGPEHLLLGLLRQPDGVAAQVLNRLGVTVINARQELVQLRDEE
jgi:ATP-dependent Clp protease ATP-binding subunit ClpA